MRIGVFFGEGFEEIEALATVDILRRAGHEVETISVSNSKHVVGARGIEIIAEYYISDIGFSNMDMIVLPGGGRGMKNLEKCDHLMRKVKKFHSEGKWIAAICASPTIFGRMGILNGERATCFPGMEGELSGAVYTGTEVEVSHNIITGRSAGCSIPFALKIIEMIDGKDAATKMAEQIYYDHFEK